MCNLLPIILGKKLPCVHNSRQREKQASAPVLQQKCLQRGSADPKVVLAKARQAAAAYVKQNSFFFLRELPWQVSSAAVESVSKPCTNKASTLGWGPGQELPTHRSIFQVGVVVGHVIQNICYGYHHGRIGSLLIFIFLVQRFLKTKTRDMKTGLFYIL